MALSIGFTELFILLYKTGIRESLFLSVALGVGMFSSDGANDLTLVCILWDFVMILKKDINFHFVNKNVYALLVSTRWHIEISFNIFEGGGGGGGGKLATRWCATLIRKSRQCTGMCFETKHRTNKSLNTGKQKCRFGTESFSKPCLNTCCFTKTRIWWQFFQNRDAIFDENASDIMPWGTTVILI